MRICFTTSDDLNQLGGSEWSIRRIADYISDGGAQVDIACLDPDSAEHAWGAEIPGVTPLTSWRPSVRLFQIRRPSDVKEASIGHRAMASALERLHEIYKYDLFHSFFLSTVGFVTTLTGQRVGRPVIVSARGSDVNRDAYSALRFSNLIWTLEHATRLTFVSRALLSLANTLVPCMDRSDIILNATSRHFFAGTPNEMLVKPTGFVIGGAGLLSYKKNWVELLEILARLRSQHLPVKLLWIGEIALSEQEPIFRSIKTLSLEDHITITGRLPHESMIAAMELLDVFILTSLDEGCPNACMEAMLAARPIVAFEIGALPQLIRSGKEGLLLKPTTTAAIVNAIRPLYFDRSYAANLGRAAQQRVLQEFTATKERAQWEACYEKALNSI